MRKQPIAATSQDATELTKCGQRFSLSPAEGERAGVRGNTIVFDASSPYFSTPFSFL